MSSLIQFVFESIRPFEKYIGGIILAILLISAEANLMPYIVKLLIDAVSSENIQMIVFTIVAYLMMLLGTSCAWAFIDWCMIKYFAPFSINIKERLLSKISKFPYSFFQNNPAGAIMTKINDIANLVPQIVNTTIYQIIRFSLTATIAIIILIKVHYILALTTVTWILIFFYKTYYGLLKVGPLTELHAEAQSTGNGYLGDYINNILNVLTFAREKSKNHRFQIINKDIIFKKQSQQFALMKFYFSQGIVVTAYSGGILAEILLLNKHHLITAGDLALIFMINFKIIDSLFVLSHQLREFATNVGTVRQSWKIFEENGDVLDVQGTQDLNVENGEIIFHRVNFAYNNSNPLFKDLSIIIPAKQKVGLVGYSGGGKSTFINLILRLFEINSGKF